ncbi:MAG: uracil-DNA glycosylase [Candidatus Fervidibacter sp.]|uniref:uracil-DNA glycosylase n=1 Tax=Candidatus Fervidibacter sp. TaxID=3100871 RepID=UPI00404B5F15
MNLWESLEAEIVSCEKCPRLVAYRREVALRKKREFRDWEYWGKPVTGFGDRGAKILVIGLAPAAHGANRTGRIFTGDSSAQTLMRALYSVGLASQPFSLHRNDSLQLWCVYLTAVCRCVPPENKPTPAELLNCSPYLVRELEILQTAKVIVSIGQIAFQWTLRALKILAEREGVKLSFSNPHYRFAHNAHYELVDPRRGTLHLLASYHPSRQNTQTGRLTIQMLTEVFAKAKSLANL